MKGQHWEDIEIRNIYNLKILQGNKKSFQQSQMQDSMRVMWEVIQHNFLDILADEHQEYNVQKTSYSQEMFRSTKRKV